jgi:predicted ribosomally synthesized peptide with SipW-like signal peptide
VSALLEAFGNFSRRYPFVLASLAVLLLSGGAYAYFNQQQQIYAALLEENRSRGEAMLQTISDQPRVQAQLGTVREAVEIIDRNLIREPDLAGNLGYFYSMESATRVRFTQLNQLSSPSLDGFAFKSVPFTLQATGTYPQVMQLIRRLESGPRVLRIRTFTLNRSEAVPGGVTADLGLEVLGAP